MINPFKIAATIVTLFCLGNQSAYADGHGERNSLKICADPVSLPSSNKAREGYENKIAELFAEELGLPLEFYWFPQRIGFFRNTLKNNETEDGSYKCDLVMSAHPSIDYAVATDPYMRSTWAMVYVKGTGLDEVEKPEDLKNLPQEVKDNLKITMWDKGPTTDWLFTQNLIEYGLPYQVMSGDVNAFPGQVILEDLAQGRVNVAFAWGPIAGYFAQQVEDKEMVVLPMTSSPDIQFDYKISMAVRFGEKEWKQTINELIAKNQDKINAILTEYGVPLLELN